MPETVNTGVQSLITSLDEAMGLQDTRAVTLRIKEKLKGLCSCEEFSLPQRYTEPCETAYARRLLHHDPRLNYTAVVMTWGPGQHTGLHDHAGIWCVECVVEGELEVTQFDLRQENEEDGRCRFRRARSVHAKVGDAGCLIPPYEYHVLANPRNDRKTVTLHVYGGEMDHCNIYEPANDGWWIRRQRQLSYDD